MPQHDWTNRAGHTPYAEWARNAADALWWLVDLDDLAFSGARTQLGGHDPDVVDLAHVRWATSTAKTAIDLCAADCAVEHGVRELWGEGPEQFEAQIQPEWLQRDHLDLLSSGEQTWLTALIADPEYLALKAARDTLTHRMAVRSALIRTRPAHGHLDRTLFALNIPTVDGRPNSRQVLLFARDVATRIVEGYLAAAGS